MCVCVFVCARTHVHMHIYAGHEWRVDNISVLLINITHPILLWDSYQKRPLSKVKGRNAMESKAVVTVAYFPNLRYFPTHSYTHL